MDTKLFYGRVTHQWYLSEAIDEVVTNSTAGADIVITGPPDGGDGSDLECCDEDELDQNQLPNEIAGEVDVFMQDDGTSDKEN